MNIDEKLEKIKKETPSTFQIIRREFEKDKLATFSLVLFLILLCIIFIGSLVINQEELMTVKLIHKYSRPGNPYILGADVGGRSILGQLIIGARNSIVIGFTVTIISQVIGITIGMIAGYYAGRIDNVIMRVIDFIIILPTTMVIIVFITLIESYSVFNFIFILTVFSWVGTARLIRSKALSESRKDYIHASKTLGTSDFKILVRELLPNISSIILVNLILAFAGNIGVETGLSFLGYGLPPTTPSLGTLISYASRPEVISSKSWVWLPASLLILVLMLCINYIGQALKRSTDARQRLG